MIKLKSLIRENYSAVILDDKSRQELLNCLKDKIPNGWNLIAHHMTIDPFKGNADERIGAPITLQAEEFGISDKAVAVKVTGYDRKTNNAYPHVTLAINTNGGGQAKDSNIIQQWTKLNKPIPLSGEIQTIMH